MAIVNFEARLKKDGSLHIPKEAVEELELHPGDAVQVSLQTSEARQDALQAEGLEKALADFVGAVRFEPTDLAENAEVYIGQIIAEKHNKEKSKDKRQAAP